MAAWFDELGERLAAQPIRVLEEGSGLRRAVVLVPLFVAAGEVWVLLTRRAAPGLSRAGEITFAGGICAEGDEDEVATALRKAGEELAMDPSAPLILGQLNHQPTASGFRISPVVCAVPHPLTLEVNSDTVAEVLHLPLIYLASPDLVEHQEVTIGGVCGTSPVFHYRRHRIAGATARILVDLLERLDLAPGS